MYINGKLSKFHIPTRQKAGDFHGLKQSNLLTYFNQMSLRLEDDLRQSCEPVVTLAVGR